MPTSRNLFQTLSVDPRKGNHAFEELRPRLAALPADALQPTEGIDLSEVASRLVEIGVKLCSDELRPRFAGLPLSEYNVSNIDLIQKAAEAVLFLEHRLNVERSRGNDPDDLDDALRRVWTILVEAYEETRAAAQFLFRAEPALLIGFPTIAQMNQ